MLVAAVVILGCQEQSASLPPTKSPPSVPEAGKSEAPRLLAADVDLAGARFILRDPESLIARPLEARGFAVAVDDLGGVARTTVSFEVVNSGKKAGEAVIALPLAPGAAVMGAALWTGGQKQQANFVPDQPEEGDAKVQPGKRLPMVLSWKRGKVTVELFPVPAASARRIEVSWVEAIGDGRYRVPVLANDGKVIAMADPVTVGGKPALVRDGIIELPAAPDIVRATRGGEQQAHYQLISGPRAPGGLVILTETGVETSETQLQWQKESISTLLALIPDTTVTVLAADWLIEPIATASKAKDVRLEALMKRRRAGLLDVESGLERALELASDIGAGAIVWVGNGRSDLAMRGRSAWLTRLAEAGLQTLLVPNPKDPGPGLGSLVQSTPGPWNRVVSSAASVGAAAVRVDRDPDPRTQWVLIASSSGAPVWISRVESAPEAESSAELGAAIEALWVRGAFTRPVLYQSALGLPTDVVGPEVSLVVGSDRKTAAVAGSPQSAGGGKSSRGGRVGRMRRPAFPVPEIIVAAPVVEGADAERIEARLQRGRSWLERCYRKRLDVGSISAQGLVRFRILGNGRPTAPRFEGLRDIPLRDCVRDWLRPKSFGFSQEERSVEVGIAFESSGMVEWQQAVKRLDEDQPAAQVEELLAGFEPGKSGQALYWSLWDKMRAGGWFRAGCRIIPWLFKESGELATARRLLSECSHDFKADVRRAYTDWKQLEDVPRVRRVLSRPGGRGPGRPR
jgi:hypothetical protein